MDWLYSANTKVPSRNVEATTVRSETIPQQELDFNNELFLNLKKNYEERIKNLENHIKVTNDIIENDEIIQTMKLSHVSDDYRRQRVQEIIEDSLVSEKEAEIEKLNKVNAYLKTELGAIEQENQKIRLIYEQEANKVQTILNELKNALQNETQANLQLQSENQQLVAGLNQLVNQKEELLRERESQTMLVGQNYQKELQQLKREVSEMKAQLAQTEELNRKKDEHIEAIKEDFEKLRNEYLQLENTHKKLQNEYSAQSQIVNKAEQVCEASRGEIEDLREKLKQSEGKIANLQKELDISSKEKAELVSKSEYISSQIKQIIENEQKTYAETIEEMKNRFKIKIEELRTQILELNLANEALVKENLAVKGELEESKLNCEKIIALMKNDMRVIKNEWEKRCQEIELTSERTIAELKTKQQMQINQMQNEYQTLVGRRMTEIQNDSEFFIPKSRSIDGEVRSQLENRISQIEKDYILKTKHENILSTEILDLRTRHAEEIKNLQDRYEKELSDKIKEVNEMNVLEYKSTVETLQAQIKSLEQQVAKLRPENQRLTESLNEETNKAQRLAIELEESDKIRKDLKDELDQINENFAKIKELYEEEVRKSLQNAQYNDETIGELNERISSLNQREQELNERLDALTNEVSELRQVNGSQEETIEKANEQTEYLNGEINNLQQIVEELESEKAKLSQQVIDLEQDLASNLETHMNNLEIVRNEANEKIENIVKEFEAKLSELETQANEFKEDALQKEQIILERNNAIEELKELASDQRAKLLELENALASSQAEYHEALNQNEATRQLLQNGLARVENIVLEDIENFREEYKGMRENVNTDLEEVQAIAIDLITQASQEFEKRLAQLKKAAKEEKEKEIARLLSNYERRLQEQERLNTEESLKEREVVGKHEAENRLLREELETQKQEMQKMWNTYKISLKKLEEENSGLRQLSDQKTAEIQQLQVFVNNEIKRLNEESARLLNEQIQQLQEKYKEEIGGVLDMIDEIKGVNVSKLKKFEDMVAEVEKVYSTFLSQLKESYEEKIRVYEMDLAEAQEEVQSKGQEILTLNEELEDLQQKYRVLREENVKAFEMFEEKIKTFRALVHKEEMEKSSKTDPNSEKLKQEIAELRKDMELKDYKIEELTRIKNSLKQDVIKYKQAFEQKEKAMEGQQKEFTKARKQRDKEIEELQALLKKSIESFNSTLDNNMRITSKLDQDTQEIAKTVRITGRSETKKRGIDVLDYKK